MKKKISVILTLVLVVNIIGISASAATVDGKYISSKGACVMDFETGDIIYELNKDVERSAASMTKIMNAYLVYEAMANGKISLDTVVPISSRVYGNNTFQGEIYLNPNARYTVDEILGIMLTMSSCGAATALSELVGGTESNFVKMMNEKAKQMGISAYYNDCCGFVPNKVTPLAMVTLARNIINDYPDILNRTSKRYVEFRGGKYKSTNRLYDTYYYEGVDGMKTGTASFAGCCFLGTAKRDGRRIITVTMGSNSSGERFTDTIKLMDYGFSVVNSKENNIYFTDMRTIINGNEVPTFEYAGSSPHALVAAEDLRNYGFDVIWHQDTLTLEIIYKGSEITPIPLEMYKTNAGKKAFNIVKNNTVKVCVKSGDRTKYLTDIYNVGGYALISIDEFQEFYDFFWSFDDNAAYITAK